MFTSSSSASRFTAGASPGESLDPQGLTLNRTNRTSLPALPLAEQKDQRAFDLVLIKVRPLAIRGVDPVPSVLSHDLDTIDRGLLPLVVSHRLEREVF
jgi:hypothetical protein